MKKEEKMDAGSQRRLTDLVPFALKRAVHSYKNFMATQPDVKLVKDFADHHRAARVAAAHILVLMKMARENRAHLPPDERDELERMIAEAEGEMAARTGEASDEIA